MLLVTQIAAWSYHFILNNKIDRAQVMIGINQRHLDRIDGRWTEFSDTGGDFSRGEHPYGRDLDIIGQSSLFQFLSTAHTWYGRSTFASDLLHAEYSKEELIKRQASVGELAENAALADELEYHFSKIGSDSQAEDLVKELSSFEPFLRSGWSKSFLSYLPLVTIPLLLLVLLIQSESLYLAGFMIVSVQAVLWIMGVSVCSRYVKRVGRLPFHLNAYYKVLKLIKMGTFESEELNRIQTKLTGGSNSAVQAIRDLESISNRVSVRGTPIVYFLLNVLLLWDFRCAFSLEKWKRTYSPYCESWFRAMGEVESLLSLATMVRVCGHSCFPSFSDERGMGAFELGHPLINDSVRVTNHLTLDDNIIIISGSNMSGKTTYLRTAGINLVLARAGGPVCAREMTFSNLHIVTSMRVADDLKEGISTFYAEMKRIKKILDSAETDDSTLFLIDEIFRGTNSVDRLMGAKAVLVKLNEYRTIGMITSHDLELCELEGAHSRIINCNFSEEYHDGQILFDYKRKEGRSQTTNGKFLMEQLGILT
jgi:ABC-type cobalt transport system substrate-binding protein